VPEGQALSKAMEIAAAIAENGPLAIEAIVRTLHETEGMTDEEAQEHERDYGMAVFRSADAKEGPLAFVERRKPVYTRS
jgi:enoyl-CoA hydratase